MYIQGEVRQNPNVTFGASAEPASIIDQIKNALVSGQYYLALALLTLSGERDESRLTNSIFFARHPERNGRKLEQGEANFKQLSAEWLDIRNNLVRPFLSKLQPGASVSPSTPAITGGKVKGGKSVQAGSCVATERRLHAANPPQLTKVPAEIEYSKGNRLDATALSAYKSMLQAARADSIPSPYLKLVSGFRDYDRQAKLWKGRLLTKFKNLGCPEASLPCIGHAINRTSAALQSLPAPHPTDAWMELFLKELAQGGCNTACDPRVAVKQLRQGTAPPGRSPHHTGRAIDIYVGGALSTKSSNVAYQRKQAAYQWLVCNAARFGFYPYSREPWHWEYNPPA